MFDKTNTLLLVTTEDLREFAFELLNEYRVQLDEQQRGEQLVPKSEAMTELKVSEVTLWRWEQSGYLKPHKIGSRVFYSRADIDAVKRG